MGTTIGSGGPESDTPRLSTLHRARLPDGPHQSKEALTAGLGVAAEFLARKARGDREEAQQADAQTLRLLAEAVAEGRVTGEDLRDLSANSRPPTRLKLV